MKDYLYNLITDKPRLFCYKETLYNKKGGGKYRGFFANIFKFFLFILSFIYGWVVRILIFIYRLNPSRLNCKVISIGNITLGGTGKTSLVEFIARYLNKQGRRVAILSRGYKRKTTNYKLQTTNYETMGDEPYMLKMTLKDIPVLVDADRIRAANQAIRDYNVDTVILDDGFQQWKIKKDLEIVTIDATDPFGNQHVIPRGILRQPLSSLKRADILLLTKTNLNPDTQDIKDFLGSINPTVPIIESIHRPVGFYKINGPKELLSLDALEGKTVTSVCGIADPDSFENLIMSLGINISLSFRFPDHYRYSQKDLENIIQQSQGKNIDTIVTTEKDAVRLLPLSVVSCQLSVLVLRIELKITKNEEGFFNRLSGLYLT